MRRVDGSGALWPPRAGQASARTHRRQIACSALDHGLQAALRHGQRRLGGQSCHAALGGLAWRVQDDTENVLLARARWLRETTGTKNLCIAGGVALNCVANGRLVRESGFENVWIQPAAGDDGIAIGCAYYGHLAIQRNPRSFVVNNAYFGMPYKDQDVDAALDKRLIRLETKRTHSKNICADTAKVLAEGRV